MDGLLIIVAIIFFIAKNIAKNKNQAQGQEKAQRPEESQQPKIDFEEIRKRFQYEVSEQYKQKQDKDFRGINRPNAEGYKEVKPKTWSSLKYESEEGSESTEGKCIEPNPSHCAVEHFEDIIYNEEIGRETGFDREDFIKGILMAEIVSKPKSLR